MSAASVFAPTSRRNGIVPRGQAGRLCPLPGAGRAEAGR